MAAALHCNPHAPWRAIDKLALDMRFEQVWEIRARARKHKIAAQWNEKEEQAAAAVVEEQVVARRRWMNRLRGGLDS